MARTGDSAPGSGGRRSGDRSGTEEASGAGAVARIDARQLFGDAREVIIVHGSQDYRLRRTNNGKLILTK